MIESPYVYWFFFIFAFVGLGVLLNSLGHLLYDIWKDWKNNESR